MICKAKAMAAMGIYMQLARNATVGERLRGSIFAVGRGSRERDHIADILHARE